MAEEKIESNDNFNFKEGQNPYVPLAPMPSFSSPNTSGSPKMSFDDVVSSIPTRGTGVGIEPIMASQLPSSSRYKFYYPGRDPEEMMAQQQGSLEKWGNGLIKLAGTTTTSFLGGTLGAVYGLSQYALTGKFSSLYNNPVNQKLDDINVAMEDYAPNFYTTAEKDAAWYSGKNILTANFWSDKVLKNLGYSIGALGAGIAWGGVLGSIGLTNRLVAAGRGLEAATAVEEAIATASPVQRFGALRGALTATSNQYLKNIGAQTLINADRGIMAAMGTMGEASFEAIQNMNSTRDKMIQGFIMKNGYSPTDDDLEEINNYAEKVGNFTWGMNVALLTATNYIQLPKILNSSKTLEKLEMNNIVKESLETGAKISEKVGAKYIADKTVAAKIGGKVGNILDKYIAKPAGLLFAPVEAFEEGAQFAIQTGTDNYFSRAYDTNEDVTNFWKNLANTFDSVLDDGVKKALSTKEGLENILIGGISGGLQTSFSPFGQSTIKERGLFGTGGTRAKNTQIAIEALNNSKNLNQVLQDGVKYANIGINSQQMRQEAVANDDTLSEKDYEQDYALSYIMPRVKYGKTDSIKEDVGLYRQQALTEQGFEELKADGIVLENEDRAQFLQRLENIIRTTDQVQKMYDMFNNRYSSILDEDNKRVYSDAAIERMVYASAKVFDYDGRLASLQPKLAEQGLLTTNIDEALKNAEGWEEGDFEKILNNEDVVSAITGAVEPISKSKEINSDAVLKDFSDYIKLILYRKMYIDDFNIIKNAPQVVQDLTTAPVSTEEAAVPSEEKPAKEQKETIKLTTQDGEEDIEIGTEYFLGRVTKKSASGKDVFFAPEFTILGENEDGTIQVKDKLGVRSVSKEEFKPYKLGKVSDTLNDKKAKFFLEHWNTIYEHYGLKDKDGKPKRGRLRYSPKEGVLEFVFLNGKGEEKSVDVTGKMFEPQSEKYVHGLLKEVGKLTPGQAKAKEDFIQEEKTKNPEVVERPNRLKILSNMFSEFSSRREKTENLIQQKTKEVTKIKEELDELEKQIEDAKINKAVKKTVRFKSVTKKALGRAMRLSRMQEQLEKQIAELEADREDIDINLLYISDLLQNIKELPNTEKKFLKELENHVLDLELLQESTGKQINLVSKLLDQTTAALEAALDFINDLISKFENKYPNVPRVMGQEYVDFLKANPRFLKYKPNYREDLAEVEDQIAFIDEGEVTPSESRLKDLNEHFSILQDSLSEVQKELGVFKNILDRFEEAHDKYNAQQAQQKALQQNRGAVIQLIGTLENSVQSIADDEASSKKTYEPSAKKSDVDIATGTIVSSDPAQENKPFNVRANNFGFKFPSLPNRDSLRGIIVTSSTENQIGLDGLTEHLVKGSNANASTVIAMVMVNENPDGTYYLVDQNGEAIPEGADLLNIAIYQVYPMSETLNSMFRADTSEDTKKTIIEEHKAWREEQLAQKVLGLPQPIDSSFGIPQYVEIPTDKSDENGKTIMERDKSARVPVESAGLVTPAMLRKSQLVTVATSNESVSNGSVTFNTPLGLVFLNVPGGMAKLFNRKFNEKEANTIFDVIQQLSANIVEDGGVKDRSKVLINWLKSVTYWGIAKDPQTKERKPAGYNNIWFEDVLEDNKLVGRLFISGRGTGFNFDPESLDENKELIVNMLQEMYHNTNATMTNEKSYSNPYYEITGIDGSGEPILKQWQNYQTYLLSSEGRNPNEIPLTTQFRPLSGPNDTNRKGIYFKLKSNIDRFTLPATPEIVEKPQEKAAPTPSLPPRPRPKAAAKALSDEEVDQKIIEQELTNGNYSYYPDLEKDETVVITKDNVKQAIAANEQESDSIFNNKTNLIVGVPEPIIKIYVSEGSYVEYVGVADLRKGLEDSKVSAEEKELVKKKLAELTGGTTQEAPAPTPKEKVLDLTGETENDIKIGKFGTVKFKLNAKAFLENGKGLSFEVPSKINAAIQEALGITEDDVKNQVAASILQFVKPQLDAMALPKVDPIEDFTEEEDDEWNGAAFEAPDDKVYRLESVQQAKQFEDWTKVEAWLKENFPMIPVYRVKNVIKATNGRQAWGFFQNASIYLSQNAEVGTVYHEVFHAVWRMFTTPEERQSIINEFKSREGSFTDYTTGESIKYSEATVKQIEEQLAEELRDLQLFNKKPVAAKEKSFIAKLLSDIVNFIKEFFTGKSAPLNVQTLFDRIGNGYYARYNPYETSLAVGKTGIIDIDDVYASEGAQYRLTPIDIDTLVKKIPAKQLHDIMQHMTYKTLTEIVTGGKSLFRLPNKTQLYDILKDDVLKTIRWKGQQYESAADKNELSKERAAEIVGNLKTLYKNVKEEWDSVMQKHQEQLAAHSITFSEDDQMILEDENKSGRSDWQDARKIDVFKKSSAGIRLLVASVPYVSIQANEIKPKRTDDGFISLIPQDVIFGTLMNELQDSTSLDKMLEKLRKIAIGNPNYRSIYERLTGKVATDPGVNLTKTKQHDVQLLAAFWNTFKKQNPDVISVFILSSGDVIIGDGSLASASKQAKRELFSSLAGVIKSNRSYFKYNEAEKTYSATAKLQGIKLNRSKIGDYVRFLKDLNIEFEESDIRNLTDNQRSMFFESTEFLLKTLSKIEDIHSINRKTLDVEGRLLGLGTVKAIIDNPDFESTYFNLNGERVQSSLGVNAMSNLYDALSKLKNIDELIGTPYEYLYPGGDVFSEGSEVLAKMFDMEGDGSRRDNTEEILKTSYIDGTLNEQTGRVRESSNYNIVDRVIQELNMNFNGVYSNLIPGDASIGWSQRMHSKESPFVTESEVMANDYFRVLRNHFIAEVNLARDGRPALRDADKLRFFRSILGKELADEITSRKNINVSPEDLFDGSEYNSRIKSAINSYVKNSTESMLELLKKYGIVELTVNGLDARGLQINEEITEEVLKRKLKTHTLNYMIANMELHKLLYSDPYQYNDELKRIKTFASPAQALVSLSNKFNSVADEAYNEGYEEGDIAHTNFGRDYFRSATISDVLSTDEVSKDYSDPYEETDGGGYITLKGVRNFKIRNSQWTDKNELQYRYDIVYEKITKGRGLSEEEKKRRGLALSNVEKTLLRKDGELDTKKNPNDKSTYTAIKPRVAGSKLNDRGYNDVVVDKFALVPLSFRILHELNPSSNAIKLYNKMQKEDVDYAVYGSGRKVGAEKLTDLYDKNAKFNEAPFQTEEELNDSSLPQGVINIPFHIMGLQSEVPSKDEAKVTQGTQVTEMVTMDFMQGGVPIDFEPAKTFEERLKLWNALEDKTGESELYDEIQNNKKLLEERVENGFDNLMAKLGMTRTEEGFEIENPDDLVSELYKEVIKSGVNDNILYALNGLKLGKVVLEATPAYQYIRNLLFAIADREIKSPKVNGGLKVQIPSTLLESVRGEVKEFTDKNGDVKRYYASKNLKFYTNKDGERVCQIMVSRWFKSDMTDAELLNYFNNTEEGQKILRGVAFRIPTQKQNSIDTFEIAQFLPEAFGDSVVVPSALVKKVGSDFDIDKLSIYLKNVYIDDNGIPKLVTRTGNKEESTKQYEDIYREVILKKFEKIQNIEKFKNDMLNVLSKIETAEGGSVLFDTKEEEDFFNEHKAILQQVIDQAADSEQNPSDYVQKELKKLQGKKEELVDKLFNTSLKEAFVNNMYTKALENEYFESMQKLISHPLNFDRLVKPNSAQQLKDLSIKVLKKIGSEPVDYKDAGNMLSFEFMTNLRQAFVSGKYAIGIAAVAQKNHAQNQRTLITIDPDRLALVTSEQDRKFLGDAKLKFEKFNKVDGKATLSFIKDGNNEDYISDVIGQFIDGYVDISKGPWIMDLGATPNVAGTWLFLVKAGVPIETVAYFMNQPIVRDYLRNVGNSGYSWLFIDDMIKSMLNTYSPISELEVEQVPNQDALYEMVGKNKDDMSDVEKSQQQFILTEFLKYAKMAEQLLTVTQATNFDTATINDPYLIFKKMLQLEKARKTIISSVDDILDASFVGTLKDTMVDVRDVFSKILISDRDSKDPNKVSVRKVMEAVLRPYANLSDREFVKVSQRAVNDLFDWAVQTNFRLNTRIADVLLGTDTEESTAKQIMAFKKKVENDPKHPLHDNYVLNSLRIDETSDKKGKPDNLYLVNKSGKSSDQNLIIYGFRQLKEGMAAENKDLYGKLVRLAVLQSGISNSPISFTSLLPYEDFETIYNETLSDLENLPNLEDYYKLGVLQRNNATNSDVVPFVRFNLRQSKNNPKYWFNTNMDFIDKKLTRAMAEKTIPRVINISPFSREGQADYITYTWELPISKAEREKRKKSGNRSHIKKGLFKKVYEVDEFGNTIPLIQESTYKGVLYRNYVYKMINAWGDSYRANEFYDSARHSQLDNDFEKVIKVTGDNKAQSAEVEDQAIVDIYYNKKQGQEAPKQIEPSPRMPEFNKLPFKSETPTMTYAGIGSRETPQEILDQMTEVAKELQSKGYTLNTGITFGGKEEGADAAFSKGSTKKNLFAPENAGEKEKTIAKEVHPLPSRLTEGGLRLMARNTNQVFGANLDTPVDFVLFYAQETAGIRPKGGTGQAVEMARRKGIPTINMSDANWREQLNNALQAPKPSMIMQPDNVQKILSGEKTTTLRTENFPSGVYNFGGKDFQVTNRGLLNIEEAGGVEAISKSEAFAETGPKYSSTKDFLAGKRKLYVYDITPVEPVAEKDWTEEDNTSENPLEC